MNIRRTFLYLVVVAVLTSGVYFLSRAPNGENERRGRDRGEIVVVTAPAELVPMVDRIESLGTLRANDSVTIVAEVSGIIDNVAFADGQRVEAGAVLVTLASQEEEADVAAAVANLEEKKKQFERLEDLAARNAASQARLDEQTAALRKAEADVQVTRARLAQHKVVAPFAGRLGLRRVSKGALANPGLEITTLDDLSVLKLDFQIPESFLPTLSSGQVIEARTVAYPDRLFTGQVETIDSRVDPVTRTVSVRALLPNPDAALRPGMSMSVELLKNRRQAVRVPEAALYALGEQQYVFVIRNGRAHLVSIVIGARQAGYMEILAGVAEGDLVVVQGLQRVRDGAAVTVVDGFQAPATTGDGPA